MKSRIEQLLLNDTVAIEDFHQIEDEYNVIIRGSKKEVYRTPNFNPINRTYEIEFRNASTRKLKVTKEIVTLSIASQNPTPYDIIYDSENTKRIKTETETQIIHTSSSEEKYNSDVAQVAKLFKVASKKVRPIQMDYGRAILHDCLRYVPFEPIKPQEHEHIKRLRNSFIYLKDDRDCYIENGFEYDINSAFPFLYSHEDFYFPIRQGHVINNVRSVSELNDYLLYSIALDVDYSNFPYMKPNKAKTYYTNYDVEMFNKAGVPYKVTRLHSLTYNCIAYKKEDCQNGKTIFGSMVERLYTLKAQQNKFSSSILKCLHGLMYQKKKERMPTDEFEALNDESYIEYRKRRLSVSMDGNITTFEPKEGEQMYKLGLARMSMFMFGFSRLDMYNRFLAPHLGFTVYRLYIDSVILDKRLEDHLVGSKLGQVKYVGAYHNMTYARVNQKHDKADALFEIEISN